MMMIKSSPAAALLSSSLLLMLLLLLSSLSSTSWLMLQVQAQQPALPVNITDDIEVRTNPKFRRGTGEIREGSYIIALSPNISRDEVADAVERLVNETKHTIMDGDGKEEKAAVVVSAILQDAFRGFTWTESNPILRLALLKRLLNSSRVHFIEEDQVVKLYQTTDNNNTNTTTDSGDGDDANNQICPGSWGLDRIDQWEPPTNGVYHYDWTGASVDVFVLDTGILATHEQFEGRATCTASYVQGASCTDGNGHGTHCAGTVGGKDYGVAKKANILGVKVLDNSGSGYNSDIISGIDFVVRARANSGRNSIISMSVGGAGDSQAMSDSIENAWYSGVFSVVAAGNENANACNFQPASSQFAMTVGSVDNDDSRSSFSNWGACVNIFAPGRYISSAWYLSNTSVNTISGTSMACPHVAGIAALFWDQQPNLTTQELWNQIAVTASIGVVKNAMGPRADVATTLGTFKTEPAIKDPLQKCPLPPAPLAPTPAPPPSSSEDEEKHLGAVITVSIAIVAIAGAVVYWCFGQIKSR